MPIEYENKYKHIANEKRRRLLGMVSMLDDTIANLTKAFEKKNILDNTIIIFTSDVTLFFLNLFMF